MTLQELLIHFEGAKKVRDNEYYVSCPNPNHNDSDPSCHITADLEEGSLKAWCFGCGKNGAELLPFVGLDKHDLFFLPGAEDQKAEPLDWATVKGQSTKEPVATYTYTDAVGDPVRRKCRYEPKDFRWQHWAGEEWASGKGDGPEYPYNLAGVLKSEIVYLVEGEKSADRLIELGLAATSTGGSQSWNKAVSPWFEGKTVIILPDNDAAGIAYADEAFRSLQPHADNVRILTLPELPPKGDPFDFFETRSLEAFNQILDAPPDLSKVLSELVIVRGEAEALIRSEVDPAARDLFTLGPDDLANFQQPDFLIEGRLQAKALAQLVGRSYTGKSFYALDCALRMTNSSQRYGLNLYGKEPADVLYLAAEGVLGMALRVAAWEEANGQKWDGNRLRFRSDVPSFLDGDRFERYLNMIRATGPWDLVIVDTLARAIPGVDENNAQDMGQVVKAAAKLMEAAGGGVLLVHHFGWEGNRQRGSSALFAACDNVIHATSEEVAGERLLRIHTEKLKDGDAAVDEDYLFEPAADSVALRAVDVDDLRGEASERAVFAFLNAQSGPVATQAVKDGAGIRMSKVPPTLERLRVAGRVNVETVGQTKRWSVARCTVTDS